MTKAIFKLSIIILGLIVSLNSCINGDSKPVADPKAVEVIPENIV